MTLSLERGPIRPPSESGSLLIRVARNCPWNRCSFCHTYQGQRFGFRDLEEIRADIRLAREIADRIEELRALPEADGRIDRPLVEALCAEGVYSRDSIHSVAAWLLNGGETVFLQDADAMAMKSAYLLELLFFIRETFPTVRRITSYCRSRTAAAKSPDELKRLGEAGLSRIHIGLESGCDDVLAFMTKGVTAAEQIAGGCAVKQAGISLCVYVMPGLGGRRWSDRHADDTAMVINRINPDFIRLRSLHVAPGSALLARMERGEFESLGDEEIVAEIGRFITGLEGINSTLVSDHVLNLLEELEGRFPDDKEKLLRIITRFFALSPEERLVFRVGRRKGIYRRLDDLSDPETYRWLKSVIDQYAEAEPGRLERDLCRVMDSFI